MQNEDSPSFQRNQINKHPPPLSSPRSPELARVSALISTAEAHLSCEWDHYQEAYRAAGADIVQSYTDLFAPKPHPYGPMLSRWVSYIPDITNDPTVPATDLFAEPFIPAL